MIYIFNEVFDLNAVHDRYRMHKLVDELYDVVIIRVDGEEEICEPENIDLDRLSFDYGDLKAHDFDLMFTTLEELERERQELHHLISAKDIKGLINCTSSLPLEVKKEEDADMVAMLESGRLKDKVEKFVEENFEEFCVEHSRSCIASNSFYIKDAKGNAILKISDHNTIFQKVKHGTPFINPIGNYGVSMTLEEVLKTVESILEEVVNSTNQEV